MRSSKKDDYHHIHDVLGYVHPPETGRAKRRHALTTSPPNCSWP